MSIIIREARNNDTETLSKLATDCFIDAHKSTLPEKGALEYSKTSFSPSTLMEIINNDNTIYLVAEEKGEIVGYTHLEILPTPSAIPTSKSAIEMVRLYAKVGHEGRGIGLHLLRKAFSSCKQSNHDYIWLQVWEGNKKAQNFYKSHGFESLGTQLFIVTKNLCRTTLIMGQPINTSKK